MSIIKSFSVGNGDMFYIKHGSDNFTVIDCCMPDDRREEITEEITEEIKNEATGKGIVRFISTHPDQDHICGLADLHKAMKFMNFYCIDNDATKKDETTDFDQYCALRDDAAKAFYLKQGRGRKWMNEGDEVRGSAGIDILWPITNNEHYLAALGDAHDGHCPNNISIIMRYRMNDG